MCGFVGLFNKDKTSVDFRLLSRMAEKLSHRGPDEEGHLAEGPVGMYHKRLSIIDLVTGKQPMSFGPLTIIFNGEIYNYIELKESLKRTGHVFSTQSDTEVILHLYLQDGPACVRRLNGMFALVLYDREKKQVLAARDHFGIKPLYYFEDERRLIFGSEIKALLEHPAVKAEPDFDAVNEYLTLQYVFNSETLFEHIHKIPPGHYFLIDLESYKKEIVKYWEPDFTVDTQHREPYFVEKLRELLEDTIRIQLRSDVPVGTYLSGGLDSSVVTMLASRIYPHRLKTFTGAFREGPEFDETAYARAVAEASRAEIFEVFPTVNDFISLLPRLIYHMDEPMAGPGLFPQFMVSRLAARHVKVVLGGQGGDEIFGGYARYVIAYLEQALKGAIFETNDEGKHIVSLKSILPNLSALKQYVPMLQNFWRQDLFEPMDARYFRLINRNGSDRSLFSDDFNAHFDIGRIYARYEKLFNYPNTLSYYNKMVHFDLTASLPALLHVEDRVTMAVSLESRVPLLDHRVVELVASMPPALKFKGAEMKYIFKKAMGDVLPPVILKRKDKMGFPVPLHLWARNKLREFCQDILLSSACRNRGLFNTARVEKLIGHEEAFGRRLWGILALELWFREFIDKKRPGKA
jgi:asparagine synthase (glutamine-hydrolysing)